MTRRPLVYLLLAASACRGSPGGTSTCPTFTSHIAVPTFHGDRPRTGWNSAEPDLTPQAVASPAFGPLWESPPFDAAVIGGVSYAPHLYASLLYEDGVTLSAGPYAGMTLDLLFAATSTGWVYAVAAFNAGCGSRPVAAGTIVWAAQLGPPEVIAGLDGGVTLGVLSTPFLDDAVQPPRLYVAAIVASEGWRVFALDATSGSVLPAWPVSLDDAALAPRDTNGPAAFTDYHVMAQRGALNLSPDGSLLYVPFGSFGDRAVGWMAAVDTRTAAVASAFSSAPSSAPVGNGGMWGPGGPAVDAAGTVFQTVGNSPPPPSCAPPAGTGAPGVWGESLLAFSPPLALSGTYTTFDYCQLDCGDAEVGATSPLLLPALDPATTSTPRLAAFADKGGTAFLVDRDRLPGRLDARQACSTDASSDGSLLPPGLQPQFGTRGPLQVFGPYAPFCADEDMARMHTMAAYYRDASGQSDLFVTGGSRPADCTAAFGVACPADCTTVVPPSLVRLKVVTAPGAPAYLAIDAQNDTLRFLNPGSPVVTSDGPAGPVVWVLDENAIRSTPLAGGAPPHPILYAVDGTTLAPLWQSGPTDLDPGGKYATPVVAHGAAFVGTDRVQAFGLRR